MGWRTFVPIRSTWFRSTQSFVYKLDRKCMINKFVIIAFAVISFAGCSTRKSIIPKMSTPVPKAGTATPVGVVVRMSDGTEQVYPLGIWIMFQNGQLRGAMPTQYVNQPATLQTNGTWTYTRPGRNVQVWRNGVLQKLNEDYTLNQAAATITPIGEPWNSIDTVQVAYLY